MEYISLKVSWTSQDFVLKVSGTKPEATELSI